MADLKRIKIVSEGTVKTTKVVDTETGKDIPFIELDWHIDVKDPVARVTIKRFARLEMEGHANVLTVCPRCKEEQDAWRKPIGVEGLARNLYVFLVDTIGDQLGLHARLEKEQVGTTDYVGLVAALKAHTQHMLSRLGEAIPDSAKVAVTPEPTEGADKAFQVCQAIVNHWDNREGGLGLDECVHLARIAITEREEARKPKPETWAEHKARKNAEFDAKYPPIRNPWDGE